MPASAASATASAVCGFPAALLLLSSYLAVALLSFFAIAFSYCFSLLCCFFTAALYCSRKQKRTGGLFTPTTASSRPWRPRQSNHRSRQYAFRQ